MDKNIFGTPLQKCSKNTGYFRNGYCTTGPSDSGKHTVCATMNPEFMKFTASKGNDLSSVVKPNENWCLCQSRYEEAFDNKKAPLVVKNATNIKTSEKIKNKINLMKGGGNTCSRGTCYEDRYNGIPIIPNEVVKFDIHDGVVYDYSGQSTFFPSKYNYKLKYTINDEEIWVSPIYMVNRDIERISALIRQEESMLDDNIDNSNINTQLNNILINRINYNRNEVNNLYILMEYLQNKIYYYPVHELAEIHNPINYDRNNEDPEDQIPLARRVYGGKKRTKRKYVKKKKSRRK